VNQKEAEKTENDRGSDLAKNQKDYKDELIQEADA